MKKLLVDTLDKYEKELRALLREIADSEQGGNNPIALYVKADLYRKIIADLKEIQKEFTSV